MSAGVDVVTFLEMTSPDQLVAGSPPPRPVVIERLGPASVELARITDAAISEPYGWSSRTAWSAAQWEDRLGRPTVQALLARTGGAVLGMVEAEVRGGGDTEIVLFGLVPAFVGRGFGGHLLTEGTRLVWEVHHPDGTPTRRVWLHTSSRDHANAMRNYERRGFRPFRIEHRPRRHDSSASG